MTIFPSGILSDICFLGPGGVGGGGSCDRCGTGQCLTCVAFLLCASPVLCVNETAAVHASQCSVVFILDIKTDFRSFSFPANGADVVIEDINDNVVPENVL